MLFGRGHLARLWNPCAAGEQTRNYSFVACLGPPSGKRPLASALLIARRSCCRGAEGQTAGAANSIPRARFRILTTHCAMLNEVLVEILLWLSRDELDKMELVTREHRQLITQHSTQLAQRVVITKVGAAERSAACLLKSFSSVPSSSIDRRFLSAPPLDGAFCNNILKELQGHRAARGVGQR